MMNEGAVSRSIATTAGSDGRMVRSAAAASRAIHSRGSASAWTRRILLATERRARGPAGRKADRLARLFEDRSRRFRKLFRQALTRDDAEIIHDLRVDSRRLQQFLDCLYPKPQPPEIRKSRKLLSRVRHAVGEWRNCDVSLELLDRRREYGKRIDRVRRRIREKRAREITKARGRLMREDLDRLRFAVRAAAARCRRGGDLDVTLRRGVRKAWTKWTTALSAAEVSPGSKELHALRIATKRLRYRIEVAADAGEPRAERTLPWLEALQEVIGRWHDEKILREMTDDDVPPLEPRAALFSAPHGAARKELECWLAAS